MKIQDDKYYTPIDLANRCIDRVIETIGLENITDVIEPSCGDGSFFHHDKLKPSLGIDICPEVLSDVTVVTADFLEIDIPYFKGRLTLGNPPYGNKMNLAQKFFKKAIEIGDYVAFILPISQLNNTQSLFEFDLVYSEDLGIVEFSGKKLHCCFNIYKRPEHGLNKKKSGRLKRVSFSRNDSKGFDDFKYDVRMCAWGDSAGRIIGEDEHYAAEYKIKVADDCEFRNEIIDFLKTFDWRSYMKCIAMRKIQIFHIVNLLRENFKDLT